MNHSTPWLSLENKTTMASCRQLISHLIILSLSILCFNLSTVHSIKCVQCYWPNCTDWTLVPTPCDPEVRFCFSRLMRGASHVVQFKMRRGCLTKARVEGYCRPTAIADETCAICDQDGCNVEEAEPIICKRCSYRLGEASLQCHQQVACFPPFRTVKPQCEASLMEIKKGTHYGCWHQLSRNHHLKVLTADLMRLNYLRCDSINCNWNMSVLYANVSGLLDTDRFCFNSKDRPNPDLAYCGQPIYTPWCVRTDAPTGKLRLSKKLELWHSPSLKTFS